MDPRAVPEDPPALLGSAKGLCLSRVKVSPLQASLGAGAGGAFHCTLGFVETGRISDVGSCLKATAPSSGCFLEGFS